MSSLTFVNPDGSIEALPMCQFVISDRQQILVIGSSCDPNREIVTTDDYPEIEAQKIGTLEEQNTLFQIAIINSLKLNEWDFEQYPNPEIILLTDKRKTNDEKINQ